jgi:hypothetical protein
MPSWEATRDGCRWWSCPYGGKSYVGFRKEIQDAARIRIGARIRVRIEPDQEPPPETRQRRVERTVEMLREGVKHP